LRLPYGVDGVVCRIQKFDARDKDILQDDDLQVIKVFIAQKRKIQVGDKLAGRHGNKGVVSIVVPVEDMPHLEDGTIVDVCLNPHGIPSRMNIGQLLETHLGYAERLKTVDRLINLVEKGDAATVALQFGIDEQRAKLLLKVCDKYFKDNGWDSAAKARNEFKVIDLSIVLNQVGLLIEDLNYKVQSPIFNGITANEITTLLDESGVDVDKTHAKVKLIDGRTGECLDHPVTVGVMYVMKLDHMADDKIHARSIGPYSRVTQQPLGGKSQNGGQRCGEMEV
jgi:DNA-directed RNA polymerase subunit beta